MENILGREREQAELSFGGLLNCNPAAFVSLCKTSGGGWEWRRRGGGLEASTVEWWCRSPERSSDPALDPHYCAETPHSGQTRIKVIFKEGSSLKLIIFIEVDHSCSNGFIVRLPQFTFLTSNSLGYIRYIYFFNRLYSEVWEYALACLTHDNTG